MGHKEDPTSYLARVDNIVDTLACLGVFPPEEDINDTIVEGLTSDYETECRAHFNKPGLTRSDIESVLRERHNGMSRKANSGGRQHTLFVGGPSRGGSRKGGQGNHGGGTGRGSSGGPGRGQGGSGTGSTRGNDRRDRGRRGGGDLTGHIVHGLPSMFWPRVGPYPGHIHRPLGSEPAIHLL